MTIRQAIQARIDALTDAEIADYKATANPLIWIEYNVLDQAEVEPRFAEAAETMLDAHLA